MVFCKMHSLFPKEKICCQHFSILQGHLKSLSNVFVLCHFVIANYMYNALRVFVVADSFICKQASYRYSQYKIQHFHKSSLSNKPANFHFLFYKLSKHHYSNTLLCIVSLYLNPRTLLAVWAGNKR